MLINLELSRFSTFIAIFRNIANFSAALPMAPALILIECR